MVSRPSLPKSVLDSVAKWLRPEGDARAISPQEPARSPEAQRLFEFKAEALAMAKTLAEQDSAESGKPRLPTMTDYFIAAERIGQKYAEEIANRGMQWNPKIYADLSGHRIEGFQINKAEIEPTRDMIRHAYVKANLLAAEQGRGKASFEEVLNTLQASHRSGEKIVSADALFAQFEKTHSALGEAGVGAAPLDVKALRNQLDLDGDGAFNDFYAAIDRHAKFENTVFSNVTFHPAGTLMRSDENGVALTEKASFVNHCTFDGMGPDDAVTFAGANFEDVHFTNIKGGKIIIPDGTQVDGMDIRGATAELHMGRASISDLDATGARIIKLTASPGTQISQSHFDGATIDMASNLQGTEWRHVSFKGANLVDVDLSGAKLYNVAFDKTNVAGLDLRGADIRDLKVDGRYADRAMLTALGAQLDENTRISINPEAQRQAQLDEIRATMQAAQHSIGKPISAAAPETQAAAQAVARASEPASPTRIAFSGNATLNDIGLTTAVASMERTVAPNEVASGANMSRGGNTQA